jgi:beta-N-acetylhexosaminidase
VAFGDILERTRLAQAAGCDVLPICNDRPAVLAVLDGFKPEPVSPASQARVVRMRARGEPPVLLRAEARWQDTVQRIAALSAAPPLVLTEGQS